MNAEDWRQALHEGLVVQFDFAGDGPTWGDLESLAGLEPRPAFPLSERYDLTLVRSLGFETVDDYFGIRNDSEVGDDVIVWLFPLIDDEEVFHHPGPFDGLRLRYSVLRNPVAHGDIFFEAVAKFTEALGVAPSYPLRSASLGRPRLLPT